MIGEGRVGAVIDLDDKDFEGWPESLAGEVYLSGSKELGYSVRENKPIAALEAAAKSKRSNSAVGKLEARIAVLEALVLS